MDLDAGGRKRREREFHDRFFADVEIRGPQNEYYDRETRGLLLELAYRRLPDLRGKDVLYLGSGTNAEIARELARRGARRVVAVDFAPAAARAVRGSLRRAADPNAALVGIMDAERLALGDRSFDLVFGRSIIHHLDLGIIRGQLDRILRPGGRAVFIEPQGSNPLINLYRRLTPRARTADEHPLRPEDIRALARGLGRLEQDHAFLFQLAAYFWVKAVPLRPLYLWSFGLLGAVDRAAFRLLPCLRRYAWVAVIAIEKQG